MREGKTNSETLPDEHSSGRSGDGSLKDDQNIGVGTEDYSDGVLNKQLQYPTLSPAVMSTPECPPNTTNSTGMLMGEGGSDRDLARQLAAAHYHSYGTALGVTIGVGCCLLLLLLNLLIFLAIYHQKTHT